MSTSYCPIHRADTTFVERLDVPAFTRRDVESLIGIDYDQLTHWARRGWLAPSGGRRKQGCYTRRDLVAVAVAADLIRLGLCHEWAVTMGKAAAAHCPVPYPHPPVRSLRQTASGRLVVTDDSFGCVTIRTGAQASSIHVSLGMLAADVARRLKTEAVT